MFYTGYIVLVVAAASGALVAVLLCYRTYSFKKL